MLVQESKRACTCERETERKRDGERQRVRVSTCERETERKRDGERQRNRVIPREMYKRERNIHTKSTYQQSRD
jgi:hypothetical protein